MTIDETTPDSAESTAISPRPLRRLGRKILIGVALFFAIGVFAQLSLDIPGRFFWPFPRASEIQSMSVTIYGGGANPAPITVLPRHFDAIRSALGPAIPDSNPAKWVAIGQLDILTKDGNAMRVGLYRTHLYFGAFSIELENTKGKTYYRGSSDKAIDDALLSAKNDQ